jgi:hypothetical protein
MTNSEITPETAVPRARASLLKRATWLGAGILAGAALLLALNFWPPSENRAANAAVQSRGDVRAADIKHKSADLYDTSYETCAALGFKRLRREPTRGPREAARAWAAGQEPAVRASAYQGCLHGLRDELAARRPTTRRP